MAEPPPPSTKQEPVRADDQDVPPIEGERVPRWLVVLVPLVAAGVASPGLGGHLLSDDFSLLYGNRVTDLGELWQVFVQQSTSLAAGGTYRPLTELSIGLDYLLWGQDAFGYHLINLLWHVINSLLCYLLVRVLVPPRPVVALTAAVLFAVHPVHGDAIFWISARSDLLCTAFYLLSMILYVRGRGSGRRRAPTVGSVVAFVLALLSKEVALSLPLLVVILDLAAPSAEGFRRRFRAHLPRYLIYFAVGGAYLALRLLVLPSIGRAQFPGLSQALFNLGLYVKLLMLPVETRTGLRGVVVLALAVIVVVVMFLRYARMGDRRNMALAFAWMVTILAPMVDVPRRWQLYLPSVGFCIFFAIVAAGLVWRRDAYHPKWLSRTSAAALLLAILGGGALLTYHATIYRRAGDQARQILTEVKEALPRPGSGQVVQVANLPSVMTSWAGDQPVFAFGFPEALKLAYDRPDIEAHVLSTLYVHGGGEPPRPTAQLGDDGDLHLTVGGGAYSFSFHTSRFTTGRDQPTKGQTFDRVAWTVHVEVVEEDSRITKLRLDPKQGTPLGDVLVWDGTHIKKLGTGQRNEETRPRDHKKQ
jgi:hypothetical protein